MYSNVKYNVYDIIMIIKMLDFLVDNIFVVFDGNIYQQKVCILIWLKRTPVISDMFLYSYEAQFMQPLLSKELNSSGISVQFTDKHIHDVLLINIIITLRTSWVRWILFNLRSWQTTTLLLLTWNYSSLSRGTVNFWVPFTTNEMISISILQTFRSWVAMFHLRPSMTFYSIIHTIYKALLLL